MRRIAKGVAEGFRAEVEVDFRVIFAPLINAEAQTDIIADAASALVGEENVDRAKSPSMGSEDFSFLMEKVPGAYIQLGNGCSAGLHNPAYNFNDEATPYGAALLATLVERQLGR
jgi:metal-dependent amidase/aminoacylase/carboxypeptidase family protein